MCRILVVPHLYHGPASRLCAVPEQGRCHEVDAIWPEVGACVVRAVDTRSEHRVRGPDGADHENLKHSPEPLGAHMCAVPGAGRCLYTVFGEDVQDGLPRHLCVPAWPGDACNNRGRERGGRR